MTLPPELLLAAKLALVAASVLLASLVARRFGHGAGGVLAGMPMIAGPITGLLLIDVAAPAVRAVCLATLACQPALMAYFVAFARAARWRRPGRAPAPVAAARAMAADAADAADSANAADAANAFDTAATRWPWWACLGFALSVFFAAGTLLLALPLPEPARVALALSSPFFGAMAMPRGGISSKPAAASSSLLRVELACRVGVAVVVAAGVMWGATQLGPGPAGLLLATPITGMVLPAFTLPRHGPGATAALLGGFVRGQAGFVIFFVLMLAVLPAMHAGLGWGLAMVASGLLPWMWVRMRRRAAA